MSDLFRLRNTSIVLFICSLALTVSACEQNTASFSAQRRAHALDQTASADPTAQLIKRLQIAKELDQSEAFDSDLTPVRRADFTVQAAKADRAIKELQNGFAVEPGEIEDALDIPPRHLTPEKRRQLIHQLEQAKTLDDQREQEILIYWQDDEPIERTQFEIQAARAGNVAKDLQLGESVHWSDIKQALYVPADPL
jgi:hypothetical protein